MKLGNVLRSDIARIFGRSAGIQFAGYAIALGLTPVAIAFYDPRHLGTFSAVFFVANLVGSYGGLRLEWAVINEHSDKAASMLMRFATSLTVAWTGATLVAMALTPSAILDHFGMVRAAAISAAPLAGVITLGIFLQAWGVRNKAYEQVYLARNVSMVSRPLFQIGLGAIWPSVLSIVASELLSRLLGSEMMRRRFAVGIAPLGPAHFLSQASRLLTGRYRQYTLVGLPSSVFTFAITESLPVLFLLLHSIEAAGAFWLVQRLFGLPVALIGNVIGDMFQGEIARRRGNRKIFRTTLQIGAVLTCGAMLIPVGSVAFYLLTVHFYDGRWLSAGEMALYLAPLGCAQFVAIPLGRSLVVLRKMHLKAYFDIALFLASAAWVVATVYLSVGLQGSLLVLSIGQTLAFLLYAGISLYAARDT